MSIRRSRRRRSGQRQAEDGGVVALDPVDEGGGVAVDGEAAGHRQRLAGGEVGVHLALDGSAVVDDGGGHPAGRRPGAGVDQRTGRSGAWRSDPRPTPTTPGPRRATAALPRVSPSTSSTVSHAEHDGVARRRADRRRRAPSARRAPGRRLAVGPVTSSSSTPLTITSGSNPASRSTRCRTRARRRRARGAVHPHQRGRRAGAVQANRWPAGSLPRMDRPPPGPVKLLGRLDGVGEG